MASTIAAPYGLRPVKLAGGQTFNHEVGEYPIASGYATAIHYGTPVRLVAGKIQVCSAANLGTSSTADRLIGVFVGCSYTDPNTLQKVWKQMYPAGTVATDIVALVIDQYDAVFQVQTSTTAVDVLANVGNSCALSGVSGGSAVTGNSTISLVATTTNANLPFKIVGLAKDPTNINAGAGLFLDVLVMANKAFHLFANNTIVG